MNVLDLLFSPKGTIKPQPFALVVAGIYILNILAGSILDGQFVMRTGLLPYVLLQIMLGWIWFVAHKKRLADAGRGYAVAASLAFLFIAGVVIFAALTAASAPAVLDKVDPAEPRVSLFAAIFAIGFIYTILTGDIFLISLFFFLLLGVPLLFTLTVVIYSIVTGARASLTTAAPPLPPLPPAMPVPEPATPLPGIEKPRSPFS